MDHNIKNLEKMANDLVKQLGGFTDVAMKSLHDAVKIAPKEHKAEIKKSIKDADLQKKFAQIKRDIHSLKK